MVWTAFDSQGFWGRIPLESHPTSKLDMLIMLSLSFLSSPILSPRPVSLANRHSFASRCTCNLCDAHTAMHDAEGFSSLSPLHASEVSLLKPVEDADQDDQLRARSVAVIVWLGYMGMDQYLLIPFLGEWTSIYQLFWCSPGVQGFDTLPYEFG